MSDESSKAALNRICNLVPELNMKHTDTLISLLKTYKGEPEEAEIVIGDDNRPDYWKEDHGADV